MTSEKSTIELVDLTGFNGRCDALYFTMERNFPPEGNEELEKWRVEKLKEAASPEIEKTYDLVVTGGGLAGCAAAMGGTALGAERHSTT